MKSYLKIITNICLTSISLSVLLGTLLTILGPINQNLKTNKKETILGKSKRYTEKELLIRKSNLSLFFDNKLKEFKRLEKLNREWESLIIKNPDLDISCFFISLDKQVYAEINSLRLNFLLQVA